MYGKWSGSAAVAAAEVPIDEYSSLYPEFGKGKGSLLPSRVGPE